MMDSLCRKGKLADSKIPAFQDRFLLNRGNLKDRFDCTSSSVLIYEGVSKSFEPQAFSPFR